MDVVELPARGCDKNGVFDDHDRHDSFFVMKLHQKPNDEEWNIHQEQVQQQIQHVEAFVWLSRAKVAFAEIEESDAGDEQRQTREHHHADQQGIWLGFDVVE